MDATEIIRLLNTDHYSPANLEEVNDLCRNYPMFNIGHMLKLRMLEALGHPLENELGLAAVYSGDRGRLYHLIREVIPEVSADEEETGEPDTGPIEFAEELSQEADVIIVQHAPYAAPVQEHDLLELDEEATGEAVGPEEHEVHEEVSAAREASLTDQDEAITDEEVPPTDGEVPSADEEEPPTDEEESTVAQEEELTSENLIRAVVKDETDMEEPEVTELPQVDVVEEEKRDSDNQKLIEQFIKGDPGPIRADSGTSIRGDVSRASIREHDGLITDTLARIYVKQGLYAKAIYSYEKLSLKYPEKSAYFAAQIEKIKNINQS